MGKMYEGVPVRVLPPGPEKGRRQRMKVKPESKEAQEVAVRLSHSSAKRRARGQF